DWVDAKQEITTRPPFDAAWVDVAGEVRHTFTHFHLILTLQYAEIDKYAQTEKGEIVGLDDFRPSDLPTLMRKAFDLVNKA
ncbi:MAG: A/G-specific adenine glycosylase, partial [Paracoccaceae bacterium]